MAKSSIKKLAKELSGTIKLDPRGNRKMTSEELQQHLKMKATGSGLTKNKKGQIERKQKHKKSYL